MGIVSLIRTGDYTASPEPEPDPLSAGSISASAGDGEVAISEGTAPSGGSGAYTRQLYRSTSGGSKGSAISGATSLPYTDEGLANDTEYFYTLEVSDGVDTDDTAQVSATPVEPSLIHPNEPVGHTVISERGFNALDEGGWNDGNGSGSPAQTLTIHTDATAPHSPSNVGRVTYPEGYPAQGSSSRAIHSSRTLSGNPRDLYFAFAIKPSANFQGHTSGDNKIVYLYEAGGEGSSHPYFALRTSGHDGGLAVSITTQQAGFSSRRWVWSGGPSGTPNEVTSTAELATIPLGEWGRVEVRIVCNTAGNEDGELHCWLNGVKVLQYTGIEFAWGNGWQTFDLHTIWGGNWEGESETEMYMDFDHLYLSEAS